MMIFFTRVHVFIRRYTLNEKSTKLSPKILLLAKYWVTKSIFSLHVSQKPKNRSCFLPVLFDLELRSFLEICVRKSFAQRIKQHARYKMRVLRESRRQT